MDGDRKYKQHGYQDAGRSNNGFRTERPTHNGPKLPIDITGPKLPRLVQSITAARCYSCSVTLPSGFDMKAACPKCGVALHCCKQCIHFDSSTRFQCLKAVPVRIPVKDQGNDCALFMPRVTVARDGAPSAGHTNGGFNRSAGPSLVQNAPRNATDARAAFDNLFKK